jgi:hypothetical protein
MSRLVADQENRGDDGNSGAGEKDSLMRMNLAEGCGAVNRETRRVSARDARQARRGQIESSRLARPASLARLAG